MLMQEATPEMVERWIEVAITNIEAADEREDTFYLFEHEPLIEYTLKILSIENNEVHILCRGIAIIDGYAESYENASFEIDCSLLIK